MPGYDAIKALLAKAGGSASEGMAGMKGMAGKLGDEAKKTAGSFRSGGLGSTALVPSEMAGASMDPMAKRKKLLALLGLLGGAGAAGGAGYEMMEGDED
jgi:hypothetical protein